MTVAMAVGLSVIAAATGVSFVSLVMAKASVADGTDPKHYNTALGASFLVIVGAWVFFFIAWIWSAVA